MKKEESMIKFVWLKNNRVARISTQNNQFGYNCSEVESLRDKINSTAQEAATGIVDRLHDDIIMKLSSDWYAPYAVDFAEGFADAVKETGTNI